MHMCICYIYIVINVQVIIIIMFLVQNIKIIIKTLTMNHELFCTS